jgi:hypothetical protein
MAVRAIHCELLARDWRITWIVPERRLDLQPSAPVPNDGFAYPNTTLDSMGPRMNK